MLRVIGGTAAALSLALLALGGCSDDSEPSPAGAAGTAPVAVDGSPGAQPVPGASGVTAPGDGAQPGSTSSPRPTPSRPANIKMPPSRVLQNGWLDATVQSTARNCYVIVTEQGVTWALYSAKAVPMTKGDKIRARVTPGKTKVNCGTGKAGTLVRVLIAPK